MADEKKGLGPVKRFGPRYGRTVKYKFAKVEIEQKKDQKCPYCSKLKVKRLSAGIYECSKCNSTFAARAYSVGSRSVIVEESVQMVAEAPKLKVKPVVEDEL